MTLLLLWLALEALLTVLDPVLFKGYWQYDPDLGFRVRSGAMGSNRYGFNDKEHPLQKKPGTYRIMIIGDSFNWAGGRSQNYTARLQKRFDRQYGTNRVEVMNVGYPATHTGEELALFQKYGLQFKPDMLVLGVCAGNDFFDGDPNRKRIVVSGTCIDIDKRRERRFLGHPIVMRSRVLMLVKQAWVMWRKVEHNPTLSTNGPAGEMFTKDAYNDILNQRLIFFNWKTYKSGKLDRNIQYILGALSDMADLAKGKGTEFRVAIFPDEVQVDPELFREVVETYKLNPDDYDLEQIQHIVLEACSKQNVPVLDLLPDFRRSTSERRLYKFRETHWNDDGNDLAARLLFDWLNPRVSNYFDLATSPLSNKQAP